MWIKQFPTLLAPCLIITLLDGTKRVIGCVQTDATTPNIVAPTMLGVVACVLAVVCKRMQQLPTLLRQQCWDLLRACWQWCANGCNNSQQCWDLQCIVGRIQPISLCKPCVMSVRGPNNVGRTVVGSCWLKKLTGFRLCATTHNNIQQHATGCANECNM